jgi:hypothetical protein
VIPDHIDWILISGSKCCKKSVHSHLCSIVFQTCAVIDPSTPNEAKRFSTGNQEEEGESSQKFENLIRKFQTQHFAVPL